MRRAAALFGLLLAACGTEEATADSPDAADAGVGDAAADDTPLCTDYCEALGSACPLLAGADAGADTCVEDCVALLAGEVGDCPPAHRALLRCASAAGALTCVEPGRAAPSGCPDAVAAWRSTCAH